MRSFLSWFLGGHGGSIMACMLGLKAFLVFSKSLKLFLRVGNVFIYDAYFHTVFRAPFSLNYKSLLFQSQQVLLFFYLIKI